MSQFNELINQREGTVYLNSAAIGLMPRLTQQKISGISFGMSQRGESALNMEHLMLVWENLQKNIAQLINGDPQGVTLTTNTASALHIVADGLFHKYQRGKNIVITDMEFTTNSYIWQMVAKRYGMEIRVVPYLDGERDLDAWEGQVNDDTVLVTLSSVQFADGYLSDIGGIAEIAHNHGAVISLDAIQQVGGVPLDVKKSEIDFVAAGGYKWQLGPMGMGFFYGRPDIIEEHESILTGWWSDTEFHNMTHHQFTPAEGARRYQQSFNPFFEAYNLSIEQILKWGVDNIHSHVTGLIKYLIDNLPNNYSIKSEARENRSNIIKIKCEGAEDKVLELKENGIAVAYREEAIRVSPHYYNTKEDISRLISIL